MFDSALKFRRTYLFIYFFINSFFAGVVLPPSDKPVLKIPSKLKEAIKSAKEQMEKRLKEEQKIVIQLSLTPLLIIWISSTCNYCYHLSLLFQKHIEIFQLLYLTVFRIFCLGSIIRHTLYIFPNIRDWILMS